MKSSERQDRAVTSKQNINQHRVSGTQSVGRAIAALRYVASFDAEGVRLVDVVNSLNLTTPTALRLLKALIDEGLVWFNKASKTYHIGAELISLAAIANSSSAPIDRYRGMLAAFAEEIGETVYLMVRRGPNMVCVDILEGSYPIRVMSFKVGEIRPLGVSSASLAFLAFLPAHEREALLAENASQYEKFGLTEKKVAKMVAEARRRGYALNPGLLIEDVYGMGFPVFENDQVVAAVGTMAIKARMTPKDRSRIAAAMQSVMAKFQV